jgi:hypothetical protein
MLLQRAKRQKEKTGAAGLGHTKNRVLIAIKTFKR